MQETQETWVWPLGGEDSLEEGTATYSSTLAWSIPWTEEPRGLQSTGSQRVRRYWSGWAASIDREGQNIKLSPCWVVTICFPRLRHPKSPNPSLCCSVPRATVCSVLIGQSLCHSGGYIFWISPLELGSAAYNWEKGGGALQQDSLLLYTENYRDRQPRGFLVAPESSDTQTPLMLYYPQDIIHPQDRFTLQRGF